MTTKTELLDENKPCDLARAAEIIKCGGLVAFPTETVYGLGADATNAKSVAKIFVAKGRPQDNPLIVHLSDPADAEKYAYCNDLYYRLSKEFMPGALTVILQKKDNIPSIVTSSLDSVAIRVPNNKTALKLIKLASVPIAAPSANLSGRPSPTTFLHVKEDLFGKIDAILCGEQSQIGLESTVVKIQNDDTLLLCRPGAVTLEQLKEFCKNVQVDPCILDQKDNLTKESFTPVSPGMKYRHYAPKAPLILLDGTEDDIIKYIENMKNIAVLCCKEDNKLQKLTNHIVIGSINDYNEQAKNLFVCLRNIDNNCDVKTIFARLPSKEGIGLALYNRMIKAAAYKIVDLKTEAKDQKTANK